MIKTEFYRTRRDGVNLYRTYSDLNMMIWRDGVLYDQAIDPEGSGRSYVETEVPIQNGDLDPQEALSIITGGIV